MPSNTIAFKTNSACTSAIRNTYLLAVQLLCKHFIVTWLWSENTDRGEKKNHEMNGVKAHETSVSCENSSPVKSLYLKYDNNIIGIETKIKLLLKQTAAIFFKECLKTKIGTLRGHVCTHFIIQENWYCEYVNVIFSNTYSN